MPDKTTRLTTAAAVLAALTALSPLSAPIRLGCRHRDVQPGLVARAARPEPAAAARAHVQPARRRLQLRRGVQEARPRGRQGRPQGADDFLAAVVARRLRPLRPVLHPHGLAQRGHLPRVRRPRRCRRRPDPLRAAQQLARQRESRQGQAPALAHQAEVRPADLLGRPHGAHRQRGARVHGLQDLRLCRRARGRLGGRRHLLGSRGQVPGGRAPQRRARPEASAGRGADGPHLREPGGPERQARPARRGA